MSHRITGNKGALVNKSVSTCYRYSLRVHRGNRRSFPVEGLTAYILSYCLRVQLLISLHLGADCRPPESPLEAVGISPVFSFCLAPTVKPGLQLFPRRSLSTLSEWLPNHLFWERTELGIHEFSRNTQNRGGSVCTSTSSNCFLWLSTDPVSKNNQLSISLLGARLHS